MASTPTVLTARDNVQLTLPAEERGAVARTIKAASLDADGEPGRGLTKARFTGNVDFLEKSATVDRDARSARLEVGLKAGLQRVRSGGVLGRRPVRGPEVLRHRRQRRNTTSTPVRST